MLNHDPHFFADRMRVQLDEGFEQVLRLFPVVARIVVDFFQ
jgi:hypothetical protein